MVPNASDLARRRLTMVAVVRTIGLIVWAAMSVPTLISLSIGLTEQIPEALITSAVFFFGGAGMGSALWFPARWFASRMMPTPRAHACPRCRYDLRSITEARCPECGIVLTREFLPGHVADGPSADPASTALLAQLVAVAIGRVLGVIGVLGFGGALFAVGVRLIAAPGWWDFEDYVMMAAWVAYLGVCVIACALPVVMPRRFARWLVPVRLAAKGALARQGPASSDPSDHDPPSERTSNASLDQTRTPTPEADPGSQTM